VPGCMRRLWLTLGLCGGCVALAVSVGVSSVDLQVRAASAWGCRLSRERADELSTACWLPCRLSRWSFLTSVLLLLHPHLLHARLAQTHLHVDSYYSICWQTFAFTRAVTRSHNAFGYRCFRHTVFEITQTNESSVFVFLLT